jgi:tetratricopeptide (TPR) repeat protein
MTKHLLTIATAAALLFGAGCKPRPKEVTSLQRKEAASLASEAQFALSVRDVARAEATLARAVTLCPDAGDYWLELGRCRVQLGKRDAAKDAYKSALAAYEDEAARDAANRASALLRQIYVLALLGRADDARSLLAKTQKDLPNNRDVRVFVEERQLEQLLASAAFKEVAL